VLDPSTRTAPIEIEIPNPGYRLKPGMYARVNITTDDRRQALVVPNNAVVDVNGRRGVFLAGDEGRASFRAVRVGLEDEANAEILEGLVEGDRVITTGAAALTDGAQYVIAGQAGEAGEGAVDAGRQGRTGGQPGTGGGGRRGGRRGGQAPAAN
jgi:RND family efflux transporter MFP subunit